MTISKVRALSSWVLSSLLLTGLLAACGEPLRAGRVTHKSFVAAHMESYTALEYDYTCGYGMNVMNGGKYEYHCGPHHVPVTKTRLAPDAWYVTLRGDCDKGKCKTRDVEVTKKLYNSLDEGEWYRIPEG